MYRSSSPLIVGGMIGSIIPLIGLIIVGIVSLNKEFFKENLEKQEHIKSIDNISERVVPLIASVVVCFGIGAGLVALGVTSPTAISVAALIANIVIVQLLSAITERFSSPPTPPGSSVDSDVKVDNTPPNTSYVLPN